MRPGSWGDAVMDRMCVYLGQVEEEIVLHEDLVIRGQHFPAGSVLSITYDVYSFAPMENRPDRSPNKEEQTAHLYVKVFDSERCGPPLVLANVEQLTTL